MFHELYKSIVIIHKLVSHSYFMDQMQIPDLSIMTKYLEFADVSQWDMVRRMMIAAAGPNLKTKYRDPKVLLPLPIDEKEEKKVKHTEIDKQAEALFLKLKGEQ